MWYRLHKLCSTHKKGPRCPCDGIGVTDQEHLTEKLMNKLQSLSGIAFRQNVDKAVHHLKVTLTVGAVDHNTDFVKTENYYQFCP